MASNQTKNRKSFKHDGRVIYEWQQSLDSLIMYVEPPPLPSGVKASSIIEVKFKANSITIGIKGNPPYLSHQTAGVVDSEQSLWYMSDSPKQKGKKQIVVQIQKAQKGVRWGSIFKGHNNLNPIQQQQLKKKMMLQRFQEEHPGFDFSNAQFNGNVPEARTFMGGLKSQ